MPIFKCLCSCFGGGPDIAADLEVVKAAPIHLVPAGNLVTKNMAEIDKPGAEGVHIPDKRIHRRSQVNFGKYSRAEAVARVTDR